MVSFKSKFRKKREIRERGRERFKQIPIERENSKGTTL